MKQFWYREIFAIKTQNLKVFCIYNKLAMRSKNCMYNGSTAMYQREPFHRNKTTDRKENTD